MRAMIRAAARSSVVSALVGGLMLSGAPVYRLGFAQTVLRHLPAVSNQRLDSIRGGVDVDSTLKFSIGIERAVFINGQLVTTSSLTSCPRPLCR
jgi:hypothetical protein